MRQIYLQRQFYHLARKNIPRPSETAKRRQKDLEVWEALRQRGMNAKEASKVVGKSAATLYRWQRRFEKEGWQGLEERSRPPKRVRQRQWSQELIEDVRALRCLYPGWGKEKIKVLLEQDGMESQYLRLAG